MRSPFPGIDPYLQRFWPSVHSKLITYIGDELNGSLLPSDLRAEVEERVLIDFPDDEHRHVVPDVSVSLTDPKARMLPRGAATGVALAEPLLVELQNQRPRERYLHITDSSGGKVITAIELLSASNKTPGRDRRKYMAKRRAYEAADVNVVEIDLFRGGRRTLPDIDHWLGKERRSPYLVITWRAQSAEAWEVTPLPVRQRLPAFRLPLRESDPDIALDLQPLLDRVYANGRYPLDYRQPPDPPMSGDDATWAAEVVQSVAAH